MADDTLARAVDVYLEELATAGIALRRETAESTIQTRVQQFALGTGLDLDAALAFYDHVTMRSWAREAAAQLRDEQPGNPLLAEIPVRVAPIGLLVRCIEALVGTHPALAQRTAANLAAYPAILLGGLAVVRCHRADLARLAAALRDGHPELARRCSLLAGPAA